MRRYSALTLGLLLSSSAISHADVDEFQTAEAQQGEANVITQKKVPWRNSTFTYENAFSALSLNQGADLTYNPYYAMSLDFKPRYYVRDDLSIRPRIVMDIELTVPDDDYRRFLLSDTYLDVVYAPSFFTIPVIDVSVLTSLRFMFPSSIVSQGRSMIMTVGPGFSLVKEIPLLKGKFLKSIGLLYGFRGSKEFYQYSLAQLGELEGCQNINRPECQHSGDRNRSWRLSNTFEVKLQLMDKLALTVDLMLFNDLLHKLDGGPYTLQDGTVVELEASDINHRATTWAIFDVSYDLFDWLWLSAGTSTYYAQLAPDSDYRTPLFNRATNIYFDVTVPIDAFVNQVRSWSGGGRAAN